MYTFETGSFCRDREREKGSFFLDKQYLCFPEYTVWSMRFVVIKLLIFRLIVNCVLLRTLHFDIQKHPSRFKDIHPTHLLSSINP